MTDTTTRLAEAIAEAPAHGLTVTETEAAYVTIAAAGDRAAADLLAAEYRHRATAARHAAEYARRHAVPFVGIAASYDDPRRLRHLARATHAERIAAAAEALA